jgi:hypothetical protein
VQTLQKEIESKKNKMVSYAKIQMVEDNINQRENILSSERAKALKMQLEAIKRQGVRGDLSTWDNLARSRKTGSVPTRLWPSATK